MTKKAGGVNPFYVLLVLIGIAFTLTACAYGVMAFKVVRTKQHAGEQHIGEQHADRQPAGAALLAYLDKHGAALMGVEVALLALCTAGAMATDRYWYRRAAQRNGPPPKNRTNPPGSEG